MSDLYRRLVALLREAGFEHVRTEGSHELWRREGDRVTVSVPYKTTSRHLANGVAKKAGLGKPF